MFQGWVMDSLWWGGAGWRSRRSSAYHSCILGTVLDSLHLSLQVNPAPFPSGCQLGLANKRHWQESERRVGCVSACKILWHWAIGW